MSETERICSCSTYYGAEQFFIAESHCFSRIFTLWVLCGCSGKAFWSATFVMIVEWYNNSYLPRLSLITNQTKPNNWILSLLKQLHVSSSLLHYITIHVFHHWLYLILLISFNMLLSSARFESNCKSWYSKASRTYFLITSHCIASYIHSEATMKHIAIQSQQEPLIWMLTQQGLSAVAQVVVSLLLSLLIYTICVWEVVNAYM